MSGRIANAFARAKAEGRSAFVAYLTIGYPTAEASEKAIDRLIDESSADIVELGVPFSDPFADGAVIRAAAYEALKRGMTLEGALEIAARVRARHPETPLVVFSYYNLILSMGAEKFAAAAEKAGVDAVLAVDLPLEERDELLTTLRRHGLTFVPLIAPNTPIERVVESAAGVEDSFLYAITVKGVTGVRGELPAELSKHLDDIRRAVKVPVAAGFGIASREQGEAVAKGHADGYIIGSAIVKRLGAGGIDSPEPLI